MSAKPIEEKVGSSAEKVTVIVTTYNPDENFNSRFSDLLNVCENVIVCDNTPGGADFSKRINGFIYLGNGTNRGLGAALNEGILSAKENGSTVAVLFDQDSSPTCELIQKLCGKLTSLRSDTTCIGPVLIDDQSGSIARINSNNTNALDYCPALPTSGMTFKLNAVDQHCLFTDDLFVDWVDHEWCYRMASKGWRFARDLETRMVHRLGEREAHFFWKRFFVPTPFRHYFQVRDAVALLRRKYVPMHAKWRILTTIPARLVLYPLILDKGLERMRWMLMGFSAALRREKGAGKCAAIVHKQRQG